MKRNAMGTTTRTDLDPVKKVKNKNITEYKKNFFRSGLLLIMKIKYRKYNERVTATWFTPS